MSDWVFHHIGIATEDLIEETKLYEMLGYTVKDHFKDPLQGVEGVFLEGPGPRLELLKNLPGSKRLDTSNLSGKKYHHMAFIFPENSDLEEICRMLDGFLVSGPLPSVYFNRPIAFIMMRNEQLVEVIL